MVLHQQFFPLSVKSYAHDLPLIFFVCYSKKT